MGDRWVYDVSIVVDGYCADTGGTLQVGCEPSDGERGIFDALSAGVDAAVELARPGVRVADLYRAAIDAIHDAGHPDYRYSLVGHGIGVEPRDDPMLVSRPASQHRFSEMSADAAVEAGMVLNIETPVIALGEGGYQHEVTCLVTADGSELLTPRREYRVV